MRTHLKNLTQTQRRVLGAVFCGFVSLLLTILFGSGLSLLTGDKTPVKIDLQQAFVHTEGTQVTEEGIEVAGSGAVAWHGIGRQSSTMYVQLGSSEEDDFPVTVSLYILQDGGSANTRVLADRVILNPAGEQSSAVMQLRSNGQLQSFELELISAGGSYQVQEMVLNRSGFSFNFLMFFALLATSLGVWAVLAFGLARYSYNPQNKKHNAALWLSAGVCILILVGLMFAVMPADAQQPPGRLLHPYPLEDLDTQPIYYQLFDALKHGQVALRTQPAAELAELPNPYDATQRQDIHYLWDTAYHEGQYYSYFGLAPMPLYFLVYALSGALPSMALACAVPAVLTVVALVAALKEFLRRFNIEANLLLFCAVIPAISFGGHLPLLLTSADIYTQPYLWAAAALLGAVAFGLRALRPAVKLRWLHALLAGLCVALVAFARPAQLLLCVALLAPPALFALQKRSIPRGEVAPAAVCFGLPLAAAAAGLLWYNAARFGSALDFGYAYQLTVGDMSLQTLRFEPVWLAEAMRLFLLQPLGTQQSFPFVYLPWSEVLYGNLFYNYFAFGLFNAPVYTSLLFTHGTLRKAEWAKKAVYIGTIAAGVIILWFDFCVSNGVYRYICDVSFAWGILAAAVLLQWLSGGAKRRKTLYTLGLLVCGVSAVVGLLLAFSNERNFILHNSTDLYILVANMFNFR